MIVAARQVRKLSKRNIVLDLVSDSLIDRFPFCNQTVDKKSGLISVKGTETCIENNSVVDLEFDFKIKLIIEDD